MILYITTNLKSLVGKSFYMMDLLDDVDRLHVKINNIAGMNLLGI